MNIYKLIFIFLFVWSFIYTLSLSIYNFKEKNIFPAVSAILLAVVSGVLCSIYITR